MLKPKKDIYFQFSSTFLKGHIIRIWFQIKDDVMMEPDRVGFEKYKSRNWNPAMGHNGIIRPVRSKRIPTNSHVGLMRQYTIYTAKFQWKTTQRNDFTNNFFLLSVKPYGTMLSFI